MKKVIFSGIGGLALVLILAFRPAYNAEPTEVVIENVDVQKKIESVPVKDHNAGQDGVMDFDEKMF